MGKRGCDRIALKEQIMEEIVGDLSGISCAKDAASEGKVRVFAKADKQGNGREKLQKLSFFKTEIMLKMDIFRQTK